MATANEILSYSGNSAFAGGLGQAGTQQVITGLWKMTDGIESAMQQIRSMNFRKAQMEYEKKLKDRDQVIELIKSDQLKTDDIDDSDRLAINNELMGFNSNFKDYVKESGGLTDQQYIELNQTYNKIRDKIAVSKANNLAIKADFKMNSIPYDPNYGVTKSSKKVENPDGSETTFTTEQGAKNPRTFDYNQKAFEAHLAKQRDLIKKNPGHKYEPFVPIEKYDYNAIMQGPIWDKVESNVDKYKKSIDFEPSMLKTVDKFNQMYQNPDTRTQLITAYKDMTEGGIESNVLIDEANKRLQELYPSNNELRITKDIPVPMFFTLLNMSRQNETKPKSKQEYVDENAKSLDLYQNQQDILEQKQVRDGNREVENYEKKKSIDQKYSKSEGSGISDDTKREIYRQRAETINDSESNLSTEQKNQKLIELQNELWGTESEIKERQKEVESSGNTNAISPKGALGEYQVMPSTAEGLEKETEFQRILRKANYPMHRSIKSKLTDPVYNEMARDYYYNKLKNMFDNDIEKTLAAYNAGPTRILKLVSKHGDSWHKYLPKETKNYLDKMASPSTTSNKPKEKLIF
jgi:hypothetical protein